MDKHYFISVVTYKSNSMGNELNTYVYEKYNHVVVSADNIYNIKYDIQMKMMKLEEQNKRCRPFLFDYIENRGIYGEIEPHFTVESETGTGKITLHVHFTYIRNAILKYRRP